MNDQFNGQYNNGYQDSFNENNTSVNSTNDSYNNPVVDENKKTMKPKKELKECINNNKNINKTLKVIKKNLDSLEKWEESYKKIKTDKNDFKNYDLLSSSISILVNNLREERYHLEAQILNNNKRIDQLKDQLKK